MAARPAWRGQIRLALVSIPVEIYPATRSGATIAFHQIHEPSGKRVRYEKVVPGIGPVDRDEILKGYEVEKGEYVLLEPEEIEKVKLESRKTLELTQFVDLDDIDPIYFDKPYYVVPADDLAEEAFVVLREALKRSTKVGIGQLAMRGQEYVVALKPCGRGMVLETLRYADEVNKASSYFRDIGDAKPDPDLLDLAKTLIEKKSGEFDASEFHNRYVDALKALIKEKHQAQGRQGHPGPRASIAPPKGSNVIDLMAALKKSLDTGKPAPAKKPAARARAAGQRRPPKRRRRASGPERWPGPGSTSRPIIRSATSPKTAEPKGRKLKGKGDSFVVQKHDASRLHWDFRLELDGVLKSWAVPKGPSIDPDDKRLAMHVEDHPLDYGGFEGTIPKGEYGGGTVMLWDKGRWMPEPGKDPSKTIEEGHLHFTLEGERMKGEWVMFRLKGREGERGEPWMLKKVDDEFAKPGAGDALVEQCVTSVTTDRTMAEIASGGDVWRRTAGRRAAGRRSGPG